MLSFRCTVLCTEKNEVKIAFRPPAPFLLSFRPFFSSTKKVPATEGFQKTRQSSLFQRRIGCQMQSRSSLLLPAKPTNATLFGSRRDVSALKKVPFVSLCDEESATIKAFQLIDMAAGKEFEPVMTPRTARKETDFEEDHIIGAGPIVIG